ncbi:MAG: TusE/DsrC/DsvC family sulfur relay protein [Pseudomonadales bacterium]
MTGAAASVQLDDEGFLQDYRLWNEQAAEVLAQREGITLTQRHWQVLYAARRFHLQFDRSPDTRPLIKWLRSELGEEFGSSIALMTLFPDEPARRVSKIAGLPKPPNCL